MLAITRFPEYLVAKMALLESTHQSHHLLIPWSKYRSRMVLVYKRRPWELCAQFIVTGWVPSTLSSPWWGNKNLGMKWSTLTIFIAVPAADRGWGLECFWPIWPSNTLWLSLSGLFLLPIGSLLYPSNNPYIPLVACLSQMWSLCPLLRPQTNPLCFAIHSTTVDLSIRFVDVLSVHD